MKSKVQVAVTLLRFANARERAYKSVGALGLAQLKAIGRIKTVVGYFSSAPAEKQINAIRQIESELTEILPGPNSRFKKQRETILSLIQQSHD